MPMTVKRRAKKALKRLRARAKRNKALRPIVLVTILDDGMRTNPDIQKPTTEVVEARPIYRTQRGSLKA